ncbi:MAG: pyruvate formate-lyase-activating protein [Gammaproteobacteria bacterium]|nr:MAG: pyruvate formate-lyase-activating protein [Gammaproteobacteria bacterium]
MTATSELKPASLEARSPFDLRVDLGKDVPETDVRSALASGDMGFLHSFTTGSTLDGPGVRVVAWTTGCMWRCLYCHNPDTWTMRNGVPVAVTRATEQLRKYRYGLKIMSGGLTISGGEPLMQDRFVVKMFQAAKGMGIHTALDSNGYYGERLTDAELDLADLVLLDLKAWDEQKHRHLTGREPGPTRDFAKRLASRRRPMWVRFVLVPGLTDDPAEVEQIARFAGSLGNVERVDVLPFHQMGRYKWEKLGIEYKLSEVEPPTTELVERVCATFRAHGLKTY